MLATSLCQMGPAPYVPGAPYVQRQRPLRAVHLAAMAFAAMELPQNQWLIRAVVLFGQMLEHDDEI